MAIAGVLNVKLITSKWPTPEDVKKYEELARTGKVAVNELQFPKQEPAERLTSMVRELAKGSSDSRLAEGALAVCDAFDEYDAAFGRIIGALK